MFEQESYNYQVPEVRPQQPGDLFYNYEIKNWNFSPRLYKILAGSAIFNILALVVIGTSGMLTTRGCDSPFVGRVCQVLDTVYVGTLLFGTESEYADVDYAKTELEDMDVTFLDVTGVTPPLTYPAGYFQLANPEQQFTNMTDPMAGFGGDMLAPGIPRSNPTIGGIGLLNTPQIMPPVNPKAIEAMHELGYDLTRHHSKALGDLPATPFDVAVTMGCGDECPTSRATRHEDWQIPDPKNLPPNEFNSVRDLIESKVKELLTSLKG